MKRRSGGRYFLPCHQSTAWVRCGISSRLMGVLSQKSPKLPTGNSLCLNAQNSESWGQDGRAFQHRTRSSSGCKSGRRDRGHAHGNSQAQAGAQLARVPGRDRRGGNWRMYRAGSRADGGMASLAGQGDLCHRTDPNRVNQRHGIFRRARHGRSHPRPRCARRDPRRSGAPPAPPPRRRRRRSA